MKSDKIHNEKVQNTKVVEIEIDENQYKVVEAIHETVVKDGLSIDDTFNFIIGLGITFYFDEMEKRFNNLLKKEKGE